MSIQSSAGEYRHSPMDPDQSMEKRRLRLLGYLIDLKSFDAIHRAEAVADIDTLRSHPSPDTLRNLERKWGRG
jgi:hypothetical protein